MFIRRLHLPLEISLGFSMDLRYPRVKKKETEKEIQQKDKSDKKKRKTEKVFFYPTLKLIIFFQPITKVTLS